MTSGSSLCTTMDAIRTGRAMSAVITRAFEELRPDSFDFGFGGVGFKEFPIVAALSLCLAL